MEADRTQTASAGENLGPVTFYVLERGTVGIVISVFAVLGALGALATYAAVSAEGAERTFFTGLAIPLTLVAVGIPAWMILRSRRDARVVIDPVRGVIRSGRSDEVPFSKVWQVEAAKKEHTYSGLGPEPDPSSMDLAWAVDIGGGCRLFAWAGLSRERVVEIAEALLVGVEAYRARTGEVADPLPRPGAALLRRMAGALHEAGETFQEDWLSLDGPMAEWMRSYDDEPDDHTMGRDGEFAQPLREAGFDLGDAPAAQIR